jgi:hypothetical protein
MAKFEEMLMTITIVNVDEGKKEWRRGWDLNPRYPLRYVRFRGGSFQPLTHLSASDNYAIVGSLASKNAQDFRHPGTRILAFVKRLN